MTARIPQLRNVRLLAFVAVSFVGLAAGLWMVEGPMAVMHALPVLFLFAALCAGWYVGEELIAALRSRRRGRWPAARTARRRPPARVLCARPRHARSRPRRGPPVLSIA